MNAISIPAFLNTKTYKVKLNNRTIVFAGRRTVFGSYEEARRAVRKLLRKKVAKGLVQRSDFGLWDGVSRNPSNLGSYRIVSA